MSASAVFNPIDINSKQYHNLFYTFFRDKSSDNEGDIRRQEYINVKGVKIRKVETASVR